MISFKRPGYHKSFADYLPYSHFFSYYDSQGEPFVDPSTIVLRDGSFMRVCKFRSVDKGYEHMEYVSCYEQVARYVSELDHGYNIQFDFFKRPVTTELTKLSYNGLTKFRDIGNKLLKRLELNFQTESYLIITYKVESTMKGFSASTKNMFVQDSDSMGDVVFATFEQFRKQSDGFIDILKKDVFSDADFLCGPNLLSYLKATTTLDCNSKIAHYKKTNFDLLSLPPIYALLDDVYVTPRYPLIVGNQVVFTVLISSFLDEGYLPYFLQMLHRHDIAFRYVSRFLNYGTKVSKDHVEKLRRKIKSNATSLKDILASKMNNNAPIESGSASSDVSVNKLEALQYEMEERSLAIGELSSSIVMWADVKNYNKVYENIKDLVTNLRQAGLAATAVNDGAFNIYLSTQPGNMIHNPCKFIVTAQNFADALLLNDRWQGDPVCKHLKEICGVGEPLIIARDTESNIYNFNLFVGDLGHTFVCGATGSGKSTFLCLLVSQWFKYPNAQVFFFDIGKTALPMVRSMGDKAFVCDVGSEENQEAFCPLDAGPNENFVEWGLTLFQYMAHNNAVSFTPQELQQIKTDLTTFKGRVDSDDSISMSLGEFKERCNVEKLSIMLEKYVTTYAYIFDGKSRLNFDALCSYFDMTKLLDNQIPADVRNIIVFYIFKVIYNQILNDYGVTADEEEILDEEGLKKQAENEFANEVDKLLVNDTGVKEKNEKPVMVQNHLRPRLIILDEAWKFLSDPMFAQKILEWIKTLRKYNTCVLLATQDIQDLTENKDNPYGMQILNNINTKVFLPVKNATAGIKELYVKYFGFSDATFQVLANAQQKSNYLITNPDGKQQMINVNLAGTADPKDSILYDLGLMKGKIK